MEARPRHSFPAGSGALTAIKVKPPIFKLCPFGPISPAFLMLICWDGEPRGQEIQKERVSFAAKERGHDGYDLIERMPDPILLLASCSFTFT
jgi:hypothetical protein